MLSMKSNIENIVKKIIFSLIPLLLILVSLEILLRVTYFQKFGEDKFATRLTYTYLANKYNQTKALHDLGKELGVDNNKKIAENIKERNQKLEEALFANEGKDLLEEFKIKYKEDFRGLVEESKKINSKLVVLYIPSDDYKNSDSIEVAREFYSSLARKYELKFIDLTDEFMKYPVESTTLLPENGHLSRLGNKIVSEKISSYINDLPDYSSRISFEKHPEIMGDLKPNSDSIWKINPSMPYRVKTNRQGFRTDYDLNFPKLKQRILFLGDSFTFGPYLNNHDTYTGILQKKYDNKEIINAGVAGYTISDEAELFSEKAKYTEPDITFIQVLDNDLAGMFYFKKNQFDRKNRVFQASKLEKEFLSKF